MFLRALIVLHRTYRRLPAGARLHTLIRFLTCPFTHVLPFLPSGATTLLEIGGGHGIFARLASDRGVRRAVVVEPDLRKTLLSPRIESDVRFVAGFDDAIRGRFDVIAIMDVLYAIPIAEWDPLLARIAERMAPGGTLLIKEQDPTDRLKNGWNRLQERLSSRFLGITMAETFNYESPGAFAARLERHGFAEVQTKRIDFAYPHPHLLYAARYRG